MHSSYLVINLFILALHIHAVHPKQFSKGFYLYKQRYFRKYLRYLIQENPYRMNYRQMLFDLSCQK